MQIPIMAGMTVKDGAFAASYPVNLEPRAIDSGVSQGQLVSTRGAVTVSTAPGPSRGSIVWNGVQYRAQGSKLVSVAADGTVAELGDIGDDGASVRFDYSFDRLAINSAGKLFYWNGTALVQVTDPDLGTVLDAVWIDGYFITTDGQYLVATELLDPAAVSPLKYGSAEEDPDPLTGVLEYRNELYGLGRHTIQVFENVGGLGFPFSVLKGATIPYGCISASAKCLVAGTFAFIGGGRDEPLGLFIAGSGTASRVSTREIEAFLNAETNPETIELEARTFGEEAHLYIHLRERTIGLALKASAAAEVAAWFHAQSGWFERYRPRHAVWFGGRHWVGDSDSGAVGYLDAGIATHFGARAAWQFDSALMFNEGAAFAIDEIELFGQYPVEGTDLFFSITRDGVAWSREISRKLTGRRDERVLWRPATRMRTMGAFRWRGDGRVAIARAEMTGEALDG